MNKLILKGTHGSVESKRDRVELASMSYLHRFAIGILKKRILNFALKLHKRMALTVRRTVSLGRKKGLSASAGMPIGMPPRKTMGAFLRNAVPWACMPVSTERCIPMGCVLHD